MKIDHELQAFTTPDHKSASDLIYDTLKPITREISNSYLRENDKVEVMQSILMKIIRMYVRVFRVYEMNSCSQNLKELLSRDTFLFIVRKVDFDAKSAAATPNLMDIEPTKDEQTKV